MECNSFWFIEGTRELRPDLQLAVKNFAKRHSAPPPGPDTVFIRDGFINNKLPHHIYTPCIQSNLIFPGKKNSLKEFNEFNNYNFMSLPAKFVSL